MVLYPTTDIKSEAKISYQYLGTKKEVEEAEVEREQEKSEEV